ncbi:MAG: glycosyltransferase family 39 protein [Planctomycetes bacterium]|nr:glycosyltransferase family 39 protein [Planctomycetia bacterium]MBI3469581.1 glycosyltransferase family 39 protein [Planctomycetota bacterium]
MLALHALLLAYGAWVHSPTFDEVAHLPSGLSHWQSGQFELYCVNPPLVRLVAALPVLAVGAKTYFPSFADDVIRRPEFVSGRRFISANAAASRNLFLVARWACIPFSLLGALACYLWAKELYGTGSAFVALGLWCFGPNILAHGQLITPDVPAAAMGVLAAYSFWRWLKEPTWLGAMEAGLTLGLVLLTKFTWLVAVPLWLVLWVMWRWRATPHPHPPPQRGEGEDARRRPSFAQLAAILVVALAIINVGYGFEGSFTRLGQFELYSRLLSGRGEDYYSGAPPGNRFRGTWLGALPVPVPKNYLRGIDVQKADLERERHSYLRGEFRIGGWWYFYLYALAVKVPLGTWLLVLMSVAALFIRRFRATWRDELLLALPVAVILVIVSSETGFTHHLRYVLPIAPFVFISASKVARSIELRYKKLAVVAGLALAWSVVSSLAVYPHSLSYFNELAGGPKNGAKHLLDSNIDWGQDLWYLRDWMTQHPHARPMGIQYFGGFDPRHVAIDCAPVPRLSVDTTERCVGPRAGWFAISVNSLYGWVARTRPSDDAYAYFRELKPVAMAGYSIYIYHITPEEANRLRRQFGFDPLPQGDPSQ